MSYFASLYDPASQLGTEIDFERKLTVANLRRIFGTAFGNTIDTTYSYTSNVVGTGSTTASNGVASIVTGATANSSAELISKPTIRAEFGKTMMAEFFARFTHTGTADNTTYIRQYADANNEFGFRLNGAFATGYTNFEVYRKRAGSITAVASGSFNGNGTLSGKSISDFISGYTATNFYEYKIKYSYKKIQFFVDDICIHTFNAVTTSLVATLLARLSLYTVNANGQTANVGVECLGMGGYQFAGDANNPLFYNNHGVAETRTLKAGGGTIHQIIIGKKGSGGDSLTIYDNTAGSGTIIALIDLQSVTGNQLSFNTAGLNFYTGLTYVSVGGTSNFTILWE